MFRLKKYKEHENVGTKLYSPYFNKVLIVTHFKDDNNWLFRIEGETTFRKAESPFSYFVDNGLTRGR